MQTELFRLKGELANAHEQLKLLVKAEIRSQSSQIERDRQLAHVRALSELALREGVPDDTCGILEDAKRLLLTTFDFDGVLSADIEAPLPEGTLRVCCQGEGGGITLPGNLSTWLAQLPGAAIARSEDGTLPPELAALVEQHGATLPLCWIVAIPLRRRPAALVALLVAWKSGSEVSFHRLPPTAHDLPFFQLLGRHLERALENAALVADLRRRGAELADANLRLRTSLESLARTHQRLHEAQKMEALGRLAGGVAHDFNNILCVILGNAGLLAETLPPSSGLEEINEIMEAAERGRDISSQLLALGRRQPEISQVLELNEVLRAQMRFLSRLVGELHPVELELAPEPFWIYGEKALLERTVMNLVLNARDAMPSGGPIRLITSRAALSELDRPGASLCKSGVVALTIVDSGLGMDEETRARIFEPFFTTKKKGHGTGLGLAVVYGTVTQYGGQIRVESKPDQGTRFTLLLPTIEPEDARDSAPSVDDSPPSSSQVRILVVEDDPTIRSVVRRVLESRGYRILVAADGAEALQMTEVMDRPPDLLLTDVVMPVWGGPKLAAALRARWPHLRVLYMSGYTFEEMDTDSAPCATEAFVAKPFTPQEISSRVAQLLGV